MSGGHWGNFEFDLENRAHYAGEIWKLMAVLLHQLDWGLSCDTCIECARRRVAIALEKFFDEHGNSIETSISVAKDHGQYKCHRCGRKN